MLSHIFSDALGSPAIGNRDKEAHHIACRHIIKSIRRSKDRSAVAHFFLILIFFFFYHLIHCFITDSHHPGPAFIAGLQYQTPTMPPYTAAQKQNIAQFCALTNSQETVATKVCVVAPRFCF